MGKEKEAKPVKVKKKRKKMSSQQIIKIVSLSLVVVFVLGIASTTIIYMITGFGRQKGSNVIEYGADYYIQVAEQYESSLAEDPDNANTIYQLSQVYTMIGYEYKGKGDENKANEYFDKALEMADRFKVLNPAMEISADYIRAGILSEKGELDEAETILVGIIDRGVDPLNSRLAYAEFLLNKREDKVKASEQIEKAKEEATNDEEIQYIDEFVIKYNLQ